MVLKWSLNCPKMVQHGRQRQTCQTNYTQIGFKIQHFEKIQNGQHGSKIGAIKTFQISDLQLIKWLRYGHFKKIEDGRHCSKIGPSNRFWGDQSNFQISALQLFKQLRYEHLKILNDHHKRTWQTKPTEFGIKIGSSNRFGGNQLKLRISALQLFNQLRYGHQKIQDGCQRQTCQTKLSQNRSQQQVWRKLA